MAGFATASRKSAAEASKRRPFKRVVSPRAMVSTGKLPSSRRIRAQTIVGGWVTVMGSEDRRPLDGRAQGAQGALDDFLTDCPVVLRVGGRLAAGMRDFD